jgi:hypothetical protein
MAPKLSGPFFYKKRPAVSADLRLEESTDEYACAKSG